MTLGRTVMVQARESVGGVGWEGGDPRAVQGGWAVELEKAEQEKKVERQARPRERRAWSTRRRAFDAQVFCPRGFWVLIRLAAATLYLPIEDAW